MRQQVPSMARWAFSVLMLVCVVIGAAIAALVFSYGGLKQGEQNEKHIDCLITYFTQTTPDACVETREKLVEDGILPLPEEQ